MKNDKVMDVQRSLHKGRRFTRTDDHDSTDSTNEKRRSLVGSTSQTAGVARSYMEVTTSSTWCKFMQARASYEVASRRQVEQRRGGKAERRKLVIIYHATDIVCSFHCQIIDCYDLNEWLTIVRYNRFSPTYRSGFDCQFFFSHNARR